MKKACIKLGNAYSVDELSIVNDDADNTVIMADHGQGESSIDIH